MALSLQLGIPISRLLSKLTNRELGLYQRYFMVFGIGQEASYLRSANEVLTIVTQIQGAMGGKPPKLTAEDIYPQLSYDKIRARGNTTVKWGSLREDQKKQFIATGLFDEEGIPIGYNKFITPKVSTKHKK